MKSELEIQKAHDMLAAIALGETPIDPEEFKGTGMHAALDALCWVLEHDHNKAFASNLSSTEDYLSHFGTMERRNN